MSMVMLSGVGASNIHELLVWPSEKGRDELPGQSSQALLGAYPVILSIANPFDVVEDLVKPQATCSPVRRRARQ
ncbi:MAG: hypothetical protein JWP44_4882 [Mucilaginibacter sp.]|jgi:hypothetical protein|nr:hypothetical protein [Mucilaginibacter sp.]